MNQYKYRWNSYHVVLVMNRCQLLCLWWSDGVWICIRTRRSFSWSMVAAWSPTRPNCTRSTNRRRMTMDSSTSSTLHRKRSAAERTRSFLFGWFSTAFHQYSERRIFPSTLVQTSVVKRNEVLMMGFWFFLWGKLYEFYRTRCFLMGNQNLFDYQMFFFHGEYFHSHSLLDFTGYIVVAH